MSGLILIFKMYDLVILYLKSKFLIYNFFYLYISFHAYESTSNDTNGFRWKDLPS
jgi:hypothetical protein